jgi:hypothetical protein
MFNGHNIFNFLRIKKRVLLPQQALAKILDASHYQHHQTK